MCESHISDPNAKPKNNDDFTFTRRQFMHTGLALLSTATTVPAFLSSAGNAMASNVPVGARAGVPEDRILVVVQLSGGNDAVNTVVPFGINNGEYYKARTSLAVKQNDVVTLEDLAGGEGIGLHPSLAPFRELMDDGVASLQLGVGYPNPNRSHFVSMDIWHSGEVDGRRSHGWIGKAADAAQLDTSKMPMITIGNDAPLAATGKQIKPISFQDARLFKWSAEGINKPLANAYDEINDLPVQAENTTSNSTSLYEQTLDPTAFLQRTALDAQVASDKVRKAVQRQLETKWPGSGLSRQLQMVAKMIEAELPTRVYYVTLGGFDTHANQNFQHTRLLREFAQAVQAFQKELTATGHADRVVTMAFSEFGRRVRQNASGGTDHGAAGHMFVVGNPVKPGIHGKYPSLTDLDRGDLKHNTDFRQVYTSLLQNWMKLDARQALGGTYQPVDLIAAAARV